MLNGLWASGVGFRFGLHHAAGDDVLDGPVRSTLLVPKRNRHRLRRPVVFREKEAREGVAEVHAQIRGNNNEIFGVNFSQRWGGNGNDKLTLTQPRVDSDTGTNSTTVNEHLKNGADAGN